MNAETLKFLRPQENRGILRRNAGGFQSPIQIPWERWNFRILSGVSKTQIAMPLAHFLNAPTSLGEIADLVTHLKSFATLRSLRRSSWFAANQERITRLLDNPFVDNLGTARTTARSWIRCISWNIEKGKKLDVLLHAVSSDRRFATADIVFLQEADLGMARSGNRFVAREIAAVLGMNCVFAPCYIELSKGVGDDLEVSGENTLSLQGNAILSRFPVTSAHIIRLPQCFEPFQFAEKRYGSRNALLCELQVNSKNLMAISTHLEVRNTPHCRARQMKALMNVLPKEFGAPVLIAGDFNSNTFPRGNTLRTIGAFLRLSALTPEEVLRSTLHPQTREPLFTLLSKNNFRWSDLNDAQPTAFTSLRSLEDLRFLPSLLHQRVLRLLRSFERGLPLRLDWFVGRNLRCAVPSTGSDAATGSLPLLPSTIDCFEEGTPAEAISDHRPIRVDLELD